MRGRDTLAAVACGILLAAGSSPGLARADDGLELFVDLAPVAQTVALLGIVVAVAGLIAERLHRARVRAEQARREALRDLFDAEGVSTDRIETVDLREIIVYTKIPDGAIETARIQPVTENRGASS